MGVHQHLPLIEGWVTKLRNLMEILLSGKGIMVGLLTFMVIQVNVHRGVSCNMTFVGQEKEVLVECDCGVIFLKCGKFTKLVYI